MTLALVAGLAGSAVATLQPLPTHAGAGHWADPGGCSSGCGGEHGREGERGRGLERRQARREGPLNQAWGQEERSERWSIWHSVRTRSGPRRRLCLHGFVESWNQADGAAYGDGYWPDAELVDPAGEVWTGRAAIAQSHVDLWGGIFKGSRIGGTVRGMRRLGPDVLLVDLDLELRGFRQRPPGGQADVQGVIRTHLKHILVQRQGSWRILCAQNTFVTPGPTQ